MAANWATQPSMPYPSIPKPQDTSGSELKFYKWTIEDFILYDYRVGHYICSPSFTVGIDCDGVPLKWTARLYPNGVNSAYAGYISVYLCVELRKNQILGQYKISIVNAKLKETNTVDCKCKQNFSKRNCESGVAKYLKRYIILDEANGLLSDGKLTMLFELRVFNAVKKSHPAQLQEHESALGNDLGYLLLNKTFSDVTLVVGDLEIPAHKAILATRSDVFAKMFKHEMIENKLNRVTIGEVEAEVLQEMLRYIYTGKVARLDKMAGALFAIADQYNIEKLMVMCGKKLYEQLSVESAVETLKLADLHNAEHLKQQVLDFIAVNAYDVMETSAWQNIVTECPRLIAEASRALAKHVICTTGVTKRVMGENDFAAANVNLSTSLPQLF